VHVSGEHRLARSGLAHDDDRQPDLGGGVVLGQIEHRRQGRRSGEDRFGCVHVVCFEERCSGREPTPPQPSLCGEAQRNVKSRHKVRRGGEFVHMGRAAHGGGWTVPKLPASASRKYAGDLFHERGRSRTCRAATLTTSADTGQGTNRRPAEGWMDGLISKGSVRFRRRGAGGRREATNHTPRKYCCVACWAAQKKRI
jgi:hypothetical protein